MKRHDRAPELRQRLSDPRDLCRRLGLIKGAQPQAGGLLVLCPAHSERTPSCSVTRGPDGTVRVRCFSCDFSGDALDLVAAVFRLSRDFEQVLERAAELAGMTLVAEVFGVNTPRTRPSEGPALPDPIFHAIATDLLTMGRLDGGAYVNDVETEDVCLYLDQRRLLDDARAEGWAALPPPGERAKEWARELVERFGEENAKASGLLRKTRGSWSFTHPENRLLIPWRSPDGAVYTIQRRRLDDASGTEAKYVIPKGRAPRHCYGCERITAGLPIAIVEGAFDVLALRRIAADEGEKASIVGIPGTSNIELAAKVPVSEVAILALDSDAAGTAANKALRRVLKRAGATRVHEWAPDPPFKDWAAQLEGSP